MDTPTHELPGGLTDPTTHPDWTRLALWRDACRAGDCCFGNPNAKPRGIAGCPGYAGSVHLEHGQLVSRYRICDRRMAWEQAETARRRAAAAGNTAHGMAVTPAKAKPRGWATGGTA